MCVTKEMGGTVSILEITVVLEWKFGAGLLKNSYLVDDYTAKKCMRKDDELENDVVGCEDSAICLLSLSFAMFSFGTLESLCPLGAGTKEASRVCEATTLP
jgi:hypothetical protein